MTTDELTTILTSEPKGRTAQIALLWLVCAFLHPFKYLFKLFALPFLWLSEAVYRAHRRMMMLVADILQEQILKKLQERGDDDDDEEI